MANKKIFNKLYILFMCFLSPFLTSKQIFVAMLAVFQGQYPSAIIMQTIRQLQWTDDKANSAICSKIFILFLSTIFAWCQGFSK